MERVFKKEEEKDLIRNLYGVPNQSFVVF